MNGFYYDLHVHSCLSPCGDNESTPNSIAGVGALAGLDLMALTDHNTCRNCPAFFAAAKRYGIVPVAGMELTTAEDIHLVCLFGTLEGAMEFGELVERRRMKIRNDPAVFGDQLVMDEFDNVIGTQPFFLPAASDITIDAAPALVRQYGGVCYPAHVDREANGVIAVLGAFPETADFANAEFSSFQNREAYLQKYPVLQTKRLLESSDAHNLWSIRDGSARLKLNAEKDDAPQKVRLALMELLQKPL